MSDEELENVQQEFARLRDKYAPLIDDAAQQFIELRLLVVSANASSSYADASMDRPVQKHLAVSIRSALNFAPANLLRSAGVYLSRRYRYMGQARRDSVRQREQKTMSLGTILVIILIIFLLGGFSGRFGGYGYGFGHGGVSVLGVLLVIVVVLLLTGRL